MPKLIMTFQGATIGEYELADREMLIGRSHQSDIRVTNPTVSGRHAKVIPMNHGYLIEDLLSTNGTYINGGKVLREPLRPGDLVTIGDFELSLVTESSASGDRSATTDTTRLLDAPAMGSGPPRDARWWRVMLIGFGFLLSFLLAYFVFSILPE